jgi:hypothetical protein
MIYGTRASKAGVCICDEGGGGVDAGDHGGVVAHVVRCGEAQIGHTKFRHRCPRSCLIQRLASILSEVGLKRYLLYIDS